MTQPNNPLHGVTLATILERLIERLGWERLAAAVDLPCFKNQPTFNSSLKFLRRHPDARKQVEDLYLRELSNDV